VAGSAHYDEAPRHSIAPGLNGRMRLLNRTAERLSGSALTASHWGKRIRKDIVPTCRHFGRTTDRRMPKDGATEVIAVAARSLPSRR
jgi:hypothetical protein